MEYIQSKTHQIEKVGNFFLCSHALFFAVPVTYYDFVVKLKQSAFASCILWQTIWRHVQLHEVFMGRIKSNCIVTGQ